MGAEEFQKDLKHMSLDEAGPGDCKGRIDVLSVVNDIAVIKITMEDYLGANYVDLHLLKKEEDGWKILAKAFTAYGK
ncbi:MAG: nuclear transport factor 2 family protein [Methanobrevibacter sp.]|nr:nuclear transport factor 2 family protein [Methanobrevibacter sp.]